jgi:FkbM family methyltransferase
MFDIVKSKIKKYLRKKVKEEYPKVLKKDTKKGVIKFWCANEQTEWRANTLMTKEKKTIKWIDGFERKDVMWDIGANVGIYTLYCAVSNERVLSFETSYSNFYNLSKNISLNKVDGRVSAYCIGIDEKNGSGVLKMENTSPGAALHEYDYEKEDEGGRYNQSVISMSVDSLVEEYGLTPPDHIKIDVDGIEHRVVEGAKKHIKGKKLSSMMIEIDTSNNDHLKALEKIKKEGFTVLDKEECILDNEYNYILRR